MPRISSLTKEDIESTGTLFVGEYTLSNAKHAFICKYCGSEFLTTPRKVFSGHTKSCGCASLGKRTGSKYLSGSFLDRCRRGAKTRKIAWNLSKEQLDRLMESQNFSCALTGRQLKFGYIHLSEYTASIDRIDSQHGYSFDNVQILHSDVNMAKQSLSQSDFITLCKEVAAHEAN